MGDLNICREDSIGGMHRLYMHWHCYEGFIVIINMKVLIFLCASSLAGCWAAVLARCLFNRVV